MKKRLFFDMDNVLVDFQSGLDKIDEGFKNRYRAKESGEKDRLDEIPGLFGLMEPMPGAIEAVHKLAEAYDVFILSTAPWKNPSAWSDKVAWVTKYFDDVFHKRMILTHRKDLVVGDYLIDDRGKNGTSEFKGEWIQFGSKRFPDWNSVVDYLYNKKIEDWQDSLSGRIVSRLYNIAKDKGEAFKIGDSPSTFEYQGRRIHIGVIVVGCHVGDIPSDDDYCYTFDLADLALCDDFRQVLFDLQSEEHNFIEISDDISFRDCVKVLGEKYESLINARTEIEQIRDSIGEKAYNDLISSIKKTLNLNLRYFFVGASGGNYNLDFLLIAHSSKDKRAVYLKEPIFIEQMDKIKDYFDKREYLKRL